MPTVNGTLKFFGPTKDGTKATLTAEWEDGEKKKWVSWEEAKPLRDARVVFKSSEVWEDGKPKWKVDGTPLVSVTTTFNGKGNPPTNIVFVGNGTEPETPPTDLTIDVSPVGWEEVERRYQTALTIATRAWRSALERLPDDNTLAAATATVFIEASKMGLRGVVSEDAPKAVGGYEDRPEALTEEEEDDLPF